MKIFSINGGGSDKKRHKSDIICHVLAEEQGRSCSFRQCQDERARAIPGRHVFTPLEFLSRSFPHGLGSGRTGLRHVLCPVGYIKSV